MRVYRQWAGSPSGHREVAANCIAEVPDGGRSVLFHQCNRRRGHGPDGSLCKQHASILSRGCHVSIPQARK
jgi:hypothetical protein